ncbi:MAG TPA: peptidase [Pseudomonadota bacterium]|nr:peptidase [Pseudomonadota bacterium]
MMKHARLFSALALIAASSTEAATITVVNIDGPGEGFNDPAVVAALPSNPFTTLGAQRLHVFQTAANQWGALLNSNVEIKVQAAFNPLTCNGTSATLGSAGAMTVHSNFANAPVANVWYNAALANSLATTDLDPATNDINSQFNVSIDTGTCLNGTAGWYYSTAASDTTPAGRLPLLPVVFHEIAHGLGFQTFTSSSTGAFFNGTAAIWDTFLADATSGTTWINMADNATRLASAISDPNLIWKGPNVTAEQANFLLGAGILTITAPGNIAGVKTAQIAAFGPLAPQSGLTGAIVAATDAGGASTLDGCEAISNAAAVTGKIALMVRGNCNFTVKVKNAQDAGAIGAVIDNNAAGLPGMAGADPTISIPSIGISQADGNAIRAELAIPNTVTGTIGFSSTLAGTQVSQGSRYVRMNAPNPVQPGSSVSHWTVDTFPNLLMEPSLNTSLFDDVDLTIPLFKDIGWNVVIPDPDAVFKNGFE